VMCCSEVPKAAGNHMTSPARSQPCGAEVEQRCHRKLAGWEATGEKEI